MVFVFRFCFRSISSFFSRKAQKRFGRPKYLFYPEIRRLDKLKKVSILGRSVFVDVLGGKFIAKGRGVRI